MVKGYWIAQVDVRDMDTYKKYVEANAAAFRKYGARFLARGGKAEAMEGTARSRTVIIEFASFEDAVACWRSEEYQAALRIREPVSEADLVIVEGYEGPQPGDG